MCFEFQSGAINRGSCFQHDGLSPGQCQRHEVSLNWIIWFMLVFFVTSEREAFTLNQLCLINWVQTCEMNESVIVSYFTVQWQYSLVCCSWIKRVQISTNMMGLTGKEALSLTFSTLCLELTGQRTGRAQEEALQSCTNLCYPMQVSGQTLELSLKYL